MDRTRCMGWAGGLVAAAVAAAPFALLWILQVSNPADPLTIRARLELAIWMAVCATQAMVAAWRLWRAWWHQAHPSSPPWTAPAGS